MEREDGDIIRDVKQGKESAYDELIRKYQKKVYNMVYGMALDYDKAWDVTQEVFVKTIKNIHNFRGDSSLWTYLYRIVKNSFYDYKRKEKVRGRVGNFSDVQDEDDQRQFEVKDIINIEEDYEKKVVRERIMKEIETLTDIQKEVFVLKNMDGFKIREIGKMLKISEGTVKSHLSRAMQKLKIILGGEAL